MTKSSSKTIRINGVEVGVAPLRLPTIPLHLPLNKSVVLNPRMVIDLKEFLCKVSEGESLVIKITDEALNGCNFRPEAPVTLVDSVKFMPDGENEESFDFLTFKPEEEI